jgi:hypothetical protein
MPDQSVSGMTAREKRTQFLKGIFCFCRNTRRDGVERRLAVDCDVFLFNDEDGEEEGVEMTKTAVINMSPSKRMKGGA